MLLSARVTQTCFVNFTFKKLNITTLTCSLRFDYDENIAFLSRIHTLFLAEHTRYNTVLDALAFNCCNYHTIWKHY